MLENPWVSPRFEHAVLWHEVSRDGLQPCEAEFCPDEAVHCNMKQEDQGMLAAIQNAVLESNGNSKQGICAVT